MALFIPPPVAESHRRAQQLADRHESIASLAVAAYETAKEEQRQADARRAAKRKELRDEFMAGWLAEYAPLASAALAEKLGLAVDHQLITKIRWTLDSSEWDSADFVQRDGMIHATGKGRRHLWTEFDGLRFSADLYEAGGGRNIFNFAAHNGTASSAGITNLEDLGNQIIAHRKRVSTAE